MGIMGKSLDYHSATTTSSSSNSPFFLSRRVLAILVSRYRIMHIRLSLHEINYVHPHVGVPMQKCLAPEHGCKLLADSLEQFLGGRRVANKCCGHTQTPRWWRLEVDAAVGERLYGIVGEGRPEQVAADTPRSLAVAAVDGGRRVQVHAEGRDRPRARLGVGSGGGAPAARRRSGGTPSARSPARSHRRRRSPAAECGCPQGRARGSPRCGAERAPLRRSGGCRGGRKPPSWRTPASLPALQCRDRRRLLSKYT